MTKFPWQPLNCETGKSFKTADLIKILFTHSFITVESTSKKIVRFFFLFLCRKKFDSLEKFPVKSSYLNNR